MVVSKTRANLAPSFYFFTFKKKDKEKQSKDCNERKQHLTLNNTW